MPVLIELTGSVNLSSLPSSATLSALDLLVKPAERRELRVDDHFSADLRERGGSGEGMEQARTAAVMETRRRDILRFF